MPAGPKRPQHVVEARGLAQVSDEGEPSVVVDRLVADRADERAAHRAGDEKERKKKLGFPLGEA